MEEYSEKKLYVFRKSYNFYYMLSIIIVVAKLVFNVSSVSSYYYVPLTLLSLISAVIEVVEKSLNLNERVTEYKLCYKFYNSLLSLLRAGKITVEEIRLREKDFMENIQFFPREKYIKETKLNGYKFISINEEI